jgi:hypothetical protein
MPEQDREDMDYQPDESGDDIGGGPVGGSDAEDGGSASGGASGGDRDANTHSRDAAEDVDDGGSSL